MSKQTEAMKLALEALKQMQAMANFECWNLDICDEAITVIREALEEQPAQQDSPWCMKMNGCKTKCEDCPDEAPKIGCVNHDCDKCKAQQEPVAIHQFRKCGCSDWYDGVPDRHDGQGPYEVRTLYTTPQAQPACEPLTPAQKIALAEDWFAEDWAITKAVGMMVEYEMRIAHGITKGGAQ